MYLSIVKDYSFILFPQSSIVLLLSMVLRTHRTVRNHRPVAAATVTASRHPDLLGPRPPHLHLQPLLLVVHKIIVLFLRYFVHLQDFVVSDQQRVQAQRKLPNQDGAVGEGGRRRFFG
jgi:hypothetical protein